MGFSEIAGKLKAPQGASDRYKALEALERQLGGTFYDDLRYSWEDEKDSSGKHIPTRQRRPSIQFNLAHEIAQDTLAELFGDEQFPIVRCLVDGEPNEDATQAVAELVHQNNVAVNLADVMTEAYQKGVVGGVGVVVRVSPEGSPYYGVYPAKWCQPFYVSNDSTTLLAMQIEYPILAAEAEERFPGITQEDGNENVEIFWFRSVIGPTVIVDYWPLPASKFENLGKPDAKTGQKIAFREFQREKHGFVNRVPAVWAKNLGGTLSDPLGKALWWPVVDICVALDYNLSQVDRGLRYGADPMLFVRKGDMMGDDIMPAGYEAPAGGMSTLEGPDGSMVKGVTQTLTGGPGSDAKFLEITAAGIKEEREFARDLREFALEILGGQKASARHLKDAASGTAMDRGLQPLRRVVRKQRRPYGNNLLLPLIDLTLYGYRVGAFEPNEELPLEKIPDTVKKTLEWPNDRTLQGAELLAHVEAAQFAAGGSLQDPVQLLNPEAVGAKLAADIGMNEPFATIKGTLEQKPEPEPAGQTKPVNPPKDDT